MTGNERASSTKAVVGSDESDDDYDTKEKKTSDVAILNKRNTSPKYTSDSCSKTRKSKNFCFYATISLLTSLLFIAIVTLIISRVHLNNCEEIRDSQQQQVSRGFQKARDVNNKTDTSAGICSYSNEAKRIELGAFLEKVKETYYEMFPHDIAYHPQSTKEMVYNRFRIHDPRPENIKRISQRADDLYAEGKRLNPDVSQLKPREHKSYLQALHFLESTFANPSLNYQSGLWMLGPSSFCAELICNIGYAIYNSVGVATPETERDIARILTHLKQVNKSVHDHISVLRMGINRGMVRTRGECVAGINAIKTHHANVSKNGPQGVLGEWYAERFIQEHFYNKLPSDVKQSYLKQYGRNISIVMKDYLKDYVGKSVHKLLNFLETEHLDACRPDDVGAGGLSALPLDVIYSNGSVIRNRTTHPYLPLCEGGERECRLSGRKAYARILSFYTTKSIHPDDVHRMGWENANRIYPQMVSIAKSLTNMNNESQAVEEFKKIVNNLKLSYFHDEPLPSNETNKDAHIKCHSDETAKRYCPKRWKAMMKWFKFAQMAMSIHDPNTVDFFFFTGRHQSTPNCPITLHVDYNPSSGAQSYDHSDVNCTTPCRYNVPFFLEHVGPKYSEYSVNAHEARPGHHTQVQGLVENFGDKCGGPEAWLQEKTYYTAFTEGWALYGEHPLISEGTNVYENNPMQKYGMLKWQMWRALRLIVDTGLHYKGYTRHKALKLFEQFAWDGTDLSKKEVTRYQSNYGQATAYMIGQLDIWALRNHTQARLNDTFNLKEFHLQTLSQGSSPLAFLASHINKYIECKMNPRLQYCDIVLNPNNNKEGGGRKNVHSSLQRGLEFELKWPRKRHYI